MAEIMPAPTNKGVVFEGSPKRNAKADALRKRGLISDHGES